MNQINEIDFNGYPRLGIGMYVSNDYKNLDPSTLNGFFFIIIYIHPITNEDIVIFGRAGGINEITSKIERDILSRRKGQKNELKGWNVKVPFRNSWITIPSNTDLTYRLDKEFKNYLVSKGINQIEKVKHGLNYKVNLEHFNLSSNPDYTSHDLLQGLEQLILSNGSTMATIPFDIKIDYNYYDRIYDEESEYGEGEDPDDTTFTYPGYYYHPGHESD